MDDRPKYIIDKESAGECECIFGYQKLSVITNYQFFYVNNQLQNLIDYLYFLPYL